MPEKERAKDLLIAIIGFSVAQGSWWALFKFKVIPQWILKFGVYAGFFTMLIYFLRLKLAAEDIDPESRQAFKEYLKLGSCYSFTLFIMELPSMLAGI